jgi:S-DNA-T family DNA segregation ATPase FtsK/SpoIIIE
VGNRQRTRKGTGTPGLKIAAFALLGLAALTALSIASPTRDPITESFISLLRRLFGWGVYLAPVALGIVGFWLLLHSMGRKARAQSSRPLGAVLLFCALLTASHLLSFPEDSWQLATDGGGGGLLGWMLSEALVAGLGTVGSLIVAMAAAAAGLVLLSGVSIAQALAASGRVCASAWDYCKTRVSLPRIPHPEMTASEASARLKEKVPTLFKLPSKEAEATADHSPPHKPSGLAARPWLLPSIEDILERNVAQAVSETEIRRKVRVIEDTLSSFGVPGRVVEVNQGPTVTQFGIQPGYVERKGRDGRLSRHKVKVSKIGALANDLSLALAATPIRIEAPVPGRSMIGIEVPNEEASLVSLRRVMQSEEFSKESSRLAIALGQDVSGVPVVADLGRMPHLLIAGATGSGKSVCINSIVTCLLLGNTPADLRLLMIDPKMVELVNFNGIPHLLSPVVVEIARVVGTLRWLLREMDRRYKLFSAAQTRGLRQYNEHLSSLGATPLPCIVLVVDELADLMMAAPDEVESALCRLAQLSRATGIHLVVATQRPSVDVVTGLIKANFPARISFAVTSQADSRVILDISGAESLLGRGDMLYMASDSSSPVRLQGCFVSDREIDRLVRFWKGMEVPRQARPEELVQQPLWPELAQIPEDQEEQPEDELLDEAIELVRQERRASTTFLQRRLRIGYVRASSLIDMLEEKGIIGPAESAGRARKVLNVEEEIPWPMT